VTYRPYKAKYRKAHKCAGCGEDVWNPPDLCHDCRRLLAYAKERIRIDESEPAWKRYVVGLGHFSMKTPVYSSTEEEVLAPIRDTLRKWLETKATAFTWFFQDGMRGETYGGKGTSRINCDGRTNDFVGARVTCLLSDEEADFIQTLIKDLRGVADFYYREGFEQGRKLLQGIAEGSLTVDQVNNYCERYGQKDKS